MALLNPTLYDGHMKKIIPAILAVALSALPIGAFAGEAFAPTQAMVQMDNQVHQLSVQARTAILQAITSQHRQLLAQVVGGLAIAPDPDYAAAGRQLDAALSPQEAQSVLRVATQFHQQMRALMQAHIAQMDRNEPKEPGETGTQTHNEVHMDGGRPEQMDAGMCLLMLAQPGFGMMHHMMINKTITH
jgi:hypothetical protein